MSLKEYAAARSAELQSQIEVLLLVMNTSSTKRDDAEHYGYTLPLRNFDRAEPTNQIRTTHADVAEAPVFMDVWPGDLGGRVNFTVATDVEEASEMGEDLAAFRFRSVKRPLLPVAQLTRHVVARESMWINRQTGVGVTSLRYFGINHNDRSSWVDLQCGRPLRETAPSELMCLLAALGYQFNADYHWHVYLKWSGAEIGLQFPTTPQGARALFRLRDYEPGASRRKALVHWVSEHSRRIRKDTDEETQAWVREHIRGATKFQWQDMEGVIYPAAADMRRVAAAKAGA